LKVEITNSLWMSKVEACNK